MINLRTAAKITAYACLITAIFSLLLAMRAIADADYIVAALDGLGSVVLIVCAKVNYDNYNRC